MISELILAYIFGAFLCVVGLILIRILEFNMIPDNDDIIDYMFISIIWPFVAFCILIYFIIFLPLFKLCKVLASTIYSVLRKEKE